METSKSQVGVYLDLVVQLVRSDPPGLVRSKHIERDVVTLRHRTEFEGLSFLTKTLPKLGKALDLGLVSGKLSVPSEFNRSCKNRNIPAFMQGYFSLVFDQDGVLLANASAEVINHLRQVLLCLYKLELPYSREDEAAVIDNFVQTELELELGADNYTNSLIEEASFIVGRVLKDFDPKDIAPRHGPGAVATGERLEEKWEFSRLYKSIHSFFPYYDYFIVGGGRELIDRLAWYKGLERLDHGRAKVVLVPKDSRGPRLISAEPLEYQWIQQGLGRKLMVHLESHWLTGGNVNFTNQKINRDLALSGSIHQDVATLDLKDASDRVSLALVRRVFSQVPVMLEALEACRTTETLLPDGRQVELRKFAPMGSALCFPVEALVFWAILVSAMCKRTRLPWSEVGKRIFVYGDDIIVPVDWAPQCMLALERVNLKVNTAKSCITGPFKESCGMDAFKGVCVTPTRLRKQWTGQHSDGTAYAAYISYANELSRKGYTLASDKIWEMLDKTYGFIPYGVVNSPYPCRIIQSAYDAEELNAQHSRVRWSDRYQRYEFWLKRVVSGRVKSALDGWTRLLRDILVASVDDRSEVVIPRSTKIKRGWMPV